MDELVTITDLDGPGFSVQVNRLSHQGRGTPTLVVRYNEWRAFVAAVNAFDPRPAGGA